MKSITLTALAGLSLISLQLPGVKSAPYILSDDRVRSMDITPVLGRGYSIMTNRFQTTCLDIDESSVPSYNYDYSFTDFTRAEDVLVEIAGRISNTFAYYYVKEQIESELLKPTCDLFKYHVVSTMRIERYYSSVKEETSPLVPNAHALLDKQDYVGFFKACGPNYVRGIRRAQEVTAVFSYFSASLDLAQEFATGLKTANDFGSSIDFNAFAKSKFNPIIDTLEIKIMGFGLGLDPYGSGSLVAPTLHDFNNVMNFAFRLMTQSESGYSRNIGMVYGIEVAPWVDNANFLVTSKMHEESVEIPLPRSLLAVAFTIDPASTTQFSNSTRDQFRCKDPSFRIDMYGYCCEREALYYAEKHEYDFKFAWDRICRPVRNLDKSLAKNNMNINAEFVARLDAAVQNRFNQIGTLEQCVSSTNMIPTQFDYHYLKPQGSVKYDASFEGTFTLAQLKQALNPFGDYSLVNHMGKELDEWMEMYYQPCIAALFGKNIGVSSDVEVSYFMSYPWHTHEECNKLSCVTPSKRWNRKEGGCVSSMMAGLDRNAPAERYFPNGETKCSYDLNSSGDNQVCKYTSADLDLYHQEVTDCWGVAIPDRRIDYLMEHFCEPEVTGMKITDESVLQQLIDETCSVRATNRRMLYKKKLAAKMADKKSSTSLKAEKVAETENVAETGKKSSGIENLKKRS